MISKNQGKEVGTNVFSILLVKKYVWLIHGNSFPCVI